MNTNNGLILVAPRIMPVLDAGFRPAVLANHAFRQQLQTAPNAVPVWLALEQSGGNVSHFSTRVFPEDHPRAAGNFTYLERITKFLLWSRGVVRIYFDGPSQLAARLQAHYRAPLTGRLGPSHCAAATAVPPA